ncbi:MAG: hypothetical protein LBF78_15120 [Treponema sp.]|jgi:uncharacterized membrane protein YkvI|nr:hypothetical protein [Treponema sp.]
MAAKQSKVMRLIVPGLIFQSILIAGGYGTGAELAEFFFPSGSLGGLLSMSIVTFLSFAVVCAATYEFARVFKTWDYRSFFKKLIGPGWIVFEICYLVLLLLVLSVVVAASGANIYDVFGLNKWVGVAIMILGVGYLVIAGTKTLIKVLSFWSYVLYAVYIVFMVLCVAKFGDKIAAQLGSLGEIKPGWIIGGGKYAFYNLACIPFLLYTVSDLESRSEAIWSGIIAAAIGIIPAIMLFISMAGQYPEILNVTVPVNYLFEQLNMRWFHVIFQIVLLGTFIETGAGFIKAASDRLEGQFCTTENPRKWIRPVSVVICLLLGLVISSFGLTGLIARGYGTITWGFFVIYVIPIITWGIYKIYRQSKASA